MSRAAKPDFDAIVVGASFACLKRRASRCKRIRARPRKLKDLNSNGMSSDGRSN